MSLGLWQDRPPAEVIRTAQVADKLGFGEIWIGEMATFDAFALAAVVAERTRAGRAHVGPLAVAVRDPVMIAMGAGSLTELTGRRVNVAIGSSSPVVVGSGTAAVRSGRARRWPSPQSQCARCWPGEGRVGRPGHPHQRVPAADRAGPVSPLTIAAFGPEAVRVAARHADRMVINLVTPKSAARLVQLLHDECRAARRPVPPVAAWVTAVVDPDPGAIEQLRRGLVAYLAVPGYSEMFAEAGFGAVVDFARTGPHPRDLLAAIPAGDRRPCRPHRGRAGHRARLADYAAAGVDEIALVPGSGSRDPAGAATLAALAPRPSPAWRNDVAARSPSGRREETVGLHPDERVREYREKGYWNDDMIDSLLRERVRHGR